MSNRSARRRVRELTRKLLASPTLPLLGWTKAVESIVASGPTVRWAGYALVVTLLWLYADQLEAAAEDAADELTED